MRAWFSLAAVIGLALAACDRPNNPCGLRVCDIRDADCQQTTAAGTACLRGVEPVAVPIRVVHHEEWVRSQSGAIPPSEEAALAWARWNDGMALMGLSPAGLTLQEANGQNAGQVAAYYANPTAGITIIDWDDPLDSLQAVALLVHEYTHALQDHTFGLGAFGQSHGTDHDRSLAAGAIIEGEASHLQDLSAVDLFGTPRNEVPWSQVFDRYLDNARRRMQASEVPVLLAWAHFRYPFGTSLVNLAWRAEGWAGVDQLLQHPPTSTRQVLLAGRDAQDPIGGPWLEDLGEDAVPVLPELFEFRQAERMGSWIMEAFVRRMGQPGLERAASGELRGDMLSLFTNRDTNEVTVYWRMRFATATMADNLAFAAQLAERGWHISRLGERDLVIIAGATIAEPDRWMAIPTATPPMSALLGSRAGCARRDF